MDEQRKKPANPLDYARQSRSGKYVVLRRTTTVTQAVPIEDYQLSGEGLDFVEFGRQMPESEIRAFEQTLSAEDAWRSITGMVESAAREELIEHTVRVNFSEKDPKPELEKS